MATREENLKKINTELKQLSDEELEKIAGGLLVIANRDKKEPDVNNGHQDKIIHWTA